MSRVRPALLVAVLVAIVALGLGLGRSGAAAGVERGSPPATTIADNDFIPENRNLGDCISAVPKPDCGSEARGGWHQSLVFVVLVAALAFIGWRIVRGARAARSPAEEERSVDDAR